MNITKNLINIFHLLIIASLVLSVSACGYKAPPYYEDDAPAADENVKFIMEKKKFGKENNESCSDK